MECITVRKETFRARFRKGHNRQNRKIFLQQENGDLKEALIKQETAEITLEVTGSKSYYKKLVPKIEFVGDSIETSDEVAQDFNNAIEYVVFAKNGNEKKYVVTRIIDDNCFISTAQQLQDLGNNYGNDTEVRCALTQDINLSSISKGSKS